MLAPGKIILKKVITRQDLRNNPYRRFVFGDNEQRDGYGGQASQMRGEPNAIGIRTKRFPGRNPEDYWTDEDYDENCRMINQDIEKIHLALSQGRWVVLPSDGIGTGMAQLEKRAPRTYNYLQGVLRQLTQQYRTEESS